MYVKDIKDFVNPIYKFSYVVELIDQEIFYISKWDNIVKLKVCSVSIQKKESGDILLELICIPINTILCPVYNYDDIILDYDDLSKIWFFSFSEAKRSLTKIKESRQINLFDVL